LTEPHLPKNIDPTQHPDLPDGYDLSWNMRLVQRLRHVFIGGAKDLNDQGLFPYGGV